MTSARSCPTTRPQLSLSSSWRRTNTPGATLRQVTSAMPASLRAPAGPPGHPRGRDVPVRVERPGGVVTLPGTSSTVEGRRMPFPHRILLASDGSPTARLAHDRTLELARATGAEVHVVHVALISPWTHPVPLSP